MNNQTKYIDIRELPKIIQKVLCKVGYMRKEITYNIVNLISLRHAPSLRYHRGFSALINLETGKYKIGVGSYGGTNQYSNTIVDDCNIEFKFPASYVIIKGEQGASGSYASMYMCPDGALPINTSEEDIEDRIYKILKIFKCAPKHKVEALAKSARVLDISDAINNSLIVMKKNMFYATTKKGKKFIHRYELMFPEKKINF